MTDREMDVFFHGEAYVAGMKKFKQLTDEIEQQHIGYFKSREPYHSSEPHEHIYNNYATTYQNKEVSLFWTKESELPNSIRVQVEAAFRQSFE